MKNLTAQVDIIKLNTWKIIVLGTNYLGRAPQICDLHVYAFRGNKFCQGAMQ